MCGLRLVNGFRSSLDLPPPFWANHLWKSPARPDSGGLLGFVVFPGPLCVCGKAGQMGGPASQAARWAVAHSEPSFICYLITLSFSLPRHCLPPHRPSVSSFRPFRCIRNVALWGSGDTAREWLGWAFHGRAGGGRKGAVSWQRERGCQIT